MLNGKAPAGQRIELRMYQIKTTRRAVLRAEGMNSTQPLKLLIIFVETLQMARNRKAPAPVRASEEALRAVVEATAGSAEGEPLNIDWEVGEMEESVFGIPSFHVNR